MKIELLDLLCDPISKKPLELQDAQTGSDGRITRGVLLGSEGRCYPIVNGIPRFVSVAPAQETVSSFGDEWNEFNFIDFKNNWLEHAVKHNFGTTEIFRNKIVVDAGAGSGSQSKWIAEAGANLVLTLELSHSVDDVMRRNLDGLENVEVIQCSIDQVPLRDNIADMVYCINVIQHTPSVERTAKELFRLVREGGEFDFSCYNELTWGRGAKRIVRRTVYGVMQPFLSRRSFRFVLGYARLMAALRTVPLLGWALEGSLFMVRGEVPRGTDSARDFAKRSAKQTALNTFDWYGSHSYQHILSQDELQKIVGSLQPDRAKTLNFDEVFVWPPKPSMAFRIFK